MELSRRERGSCLVGAGGAGSAIAIALLEAGVRELVVHDADESQVATLIDLLSGRGQGRVSAGPPDPTGCDLVCRESLQQSSDHRRLRGALTEQHRNKAKG
jgi:shikimate 5-dehydrogenase